MTQKDKLRASCLFAMRVKSIAESIRADGNDYDMQWHKSYCNELTEASEELLKKLR